MQKDFVVANGAKLYYEIKGNGHPIIFIHGFSLDTRMWDEQFDYFAKYYQVIRYDLRGFGKSTLPNEKSYSHTDDLKALMNKLKIDAACIVGLSRGGRWAIQFALDYEDAVEALVVADAMPTGFKPLSERPSQDISIISSFHGNVIDEAKAKWLNHPLFDHARKNPKVFDILQRMVADYSGWHWINQDPIIFNSPLAAEVLYKIKAPTLLIIGGNDLAIFQDAVDYMAKHISNVQKITIPNVGHMSNMEDPNYFNSALSEFLKTVWV